MAAGSLLDHLDTLLSFVRHEPSGLFLDLDGTLAEIVPRPDDTAVRPVVTRTLRALQRRLALVAVVTGRPALQARDILGVEELVYAGNHGLELMEERRLEVAEEARPHVEGISRLLGRVRAAFPEEGIVFEEKAGSFAVHYRLAADPKGVRDGLLRFIGKEAGEWVKLIMGKEVTNVLAPVELNKGTALTYLSRKHHLAAAVVMGDDVTDLDAFRASRELQEAGEMRSLRDRRGGRGVAARGRGGDGLHPGRSRRGGAGPGLAGGAYPLVVSQLGLWGEGRFPSNDIFEILLTST